jgi:formylglycine-generating enzyme required for sulfatase activity
VQLLARQFGEERWREVIRLFVAMAPRSLFETFMQEVISAGRLKGRHADMSLCLREALQPSEAPFAKALRDPAQRRDALQALAVLRDLNPEPMRRLAEEITANPKRFFGSAKLSDEVRAMASRLLVPAAVMPTEAPPTAPPLEGPLVFISYSRRDESEVRRIHDTLARAGIRTWLDTREIKAGDVIGKRIEEGVTGCTYFVPILSPTYQSSEWTQLETNLAWQREVEEGRSLVLPLLLRGETRSLPLRYRAHRFIDLRAGFDAGLTELVEHVRRPAAEQPAVRVNPRDGTELVLIQAGVFKAGDKAEADNRPRDIDLPAFYLAKTPVTNAQYRKYLEANPKLRKPEYLDDERFRGDEQPVVGIDAGEAEAYCRWAGLRLPTEWEWEKGARGTGGHRYPWGNKPEPTPELANFGMNVGQPTPVGSYPKGASPYGLLDMAGNVWEWTASCYGEGKGMRTVRGGSFLDGPQFLRAAIRYGYHPDYRGHLIGFRCAQDP